MQFVNQLYESLNSDNHGAKDNKILIDTKNICHFILQQYICHFAFNTFDVMPNEDFIFHLIELMSNEEQQDDYKTIHEDQEEETFVADSYTKQEIASKILKLINSNYDEDDLEMKRILQKLNDALDKSQLLSSVLLRAAESEEHSKWLKKSRKKHLPTEKNINAATKQL